MAVLDEKLSTFLGWLESLVVVHEVGLRVGRPPSVVVDIPKLGTVGDSLELRDTQRLLIDQDLLYQGGLFRQFILVVQQLVIIPILLPVTACIA